MSKAAPFLVLLVVLPLGCEDAGDEAPTPGVDPGTVVVHRLNRAEYDNTVRDLLGTALTPARDFPEDDIGYGFDNIASVLSTSPFHVEMYERAADELLDEVLARPPEGVPLDVVVEAEDENTTTTNGGPWEGRGWNLWSNGEVSVFLEAPFEGTYRVTALLASTLGGDALPHAEIRVDDIDVVGFDVDAPRAEPREYTAEFEVGAGSRKFAVAFTNDFYDPDAGEDRNLYVDWFRVEGPLGWSPEPNEAREALVPCEPGSEAGEEACLRTTLEAFLPRAFRRPVAAEEVDSYVGFLEVARSLGEGFDGAVRQSFKAALMSPHFVYCFERDAAPDDPTVHPVTQHELASRLSYFLWSSMPDAELTAAADAGSLAGDELVRQARRMLADPKAEALVDNFAGQWLYVRAIADAAPDVWHFPDFDEPLRAAMAEEMRLFFRTFLRDGRPMTELLTSTETRVNARLAAHYGIDGVTGDDFALVAPADRRGLLSMAGLLTATSYPTRTSPVKRGQWVLSQLLCSEPEPPPPGVEGLPEGVDQDLPLRERLEQHRADPECASCHEVMDQIGFGLEHFDGVGAYRADEDGLPIDASGVLPGDETFEGALELADILARNAWFGRCLSRQLTTYALGRGMFAEDRVMLDAVAADFVADGGRLEDLVVRIVAGDLFRMRRGGANAGNPL